jgi:hypothetical protein
VRVFDFSQIFETIIGKNLRIFGINLEIQIFLGTADLHPCCKSASEVFDFAQSTINRALFLMKAAQPAGEGIQRLRETNAQAISATYAARRKARASLYGSRRGNREQGLCASPSTPG